VDEKGADQAIEIKGMEAARSDWTQAAARLQRELLQLLFEDAEQKAISDHIAERIRAVQNGECDEELRYSRRLRKSVDTYTKSSPPHVQAARFLPIEEQGGTIHYQITTEGPRPVGMPGTTIDYEHYIEKQLRPIAEPICEVAGIDCEPLFDPSQQLSLF
jgi:DNA polymerase-2